MSAMFRDLVKRPSPLAVQTPIHVSISVTSNNLRSLLSWDTSLLQCLSRKEFKQTVLGWRVEERFHSQYVDVAFKFKSWDVLQPFGFVDTRPVYLPCIFMCIIM